MWVCAVPYLPFDSRLDDRRGKNLLSFAPLLLLCLPTPKSARSVRNTTPSRKTASFLSIFENMPAQERQFASSPSSGAAVRKNPANGRRNVVNRCVHAPARDNSIDLAPGAVAPRALSTAQSANGNHESATAQRLSPHSLQKQVDVDAKSLSDTLLSHSSKACDPSSSRKFEGVVSSSSMLVDQVGKDSTLDRVDSLLDSNSSPSSDGVSDEASSSETDDCSQTSSNSSESSSESSEEGVPPQAAQHARKVDTSTLLLPPVGALTATTTLILFDWDDTLLASTHLANSNYRLDEPEFLPESVTQQLSLLEDAVIGVLDLADTLGTVCIITNAETGWVELSCKKFLPRVMSHVENLPIVSARSTYEPKFPSLPSKWKLEAFSHRIGQLCVETPHSEAKNVISLGDSHAEREAVRTVTRDLPSTITKSIKFVERPTLEQLLRELQLVVQCFPMICEMRSDLDLALTVEALPVSSVSV